MLLDALGLLEDEVWQRIERVEIQGGGPMEPLVRTRVAALQAQGRPIDAGRYLAKTEAEAAIARADWVLIPSRIESIPVVFSDAMKLGRPVVAMPVGDLPQLLKDGPTGMVADGLEADAFATAIKRLLAGPNLTHFTPGIAKMRARFSLEEIAAWLATRVPEEAR